MRRRDPVQDGPARQSHATAPGLEQQIAQPQVRLNALVPLRAGIPTPTRCAITACARWNGSRNGSVSVATPLGRDLGARNRQRLCRDRPFRAFGNSIATRPAVRSAFGSSTRATTSSSRPSSPLRAAMGFQPTFDTRPVDPAGLQIGLNNASISTAICARSDRRATSAATFPRPHGIRVTPRALAADVAERPCSSSPASLSFTATLSATLSLGNTSPAGSDRNRDGFPARESEIQPIAASSRFLR